MLVTKLTAVLSASCQVKAGSCCGLSGSRCCEHQHGEERREADQVEEEHGAGVALPVHLLSGVDPAEPVEQPFDRREERGEHGPLPLVDLGHESADRFDGEQQDGEEYRDLRPCEDAHVSNLLFPGIPFPAFHEPNRQAEVLSQRHDNLGVPCAAVSHVKQVSRRKVKTG